MPKSRRVKVWVYLATSLVLAFVFLVLEIQALSLFVAPSYFDKTLYGIAIFPLWALNAFPAGYILRFLGLRAYRPAPGRASAEVAQAEETQADR